MRSARLYLSLATALGRGDIRDIIIYFRGQPFVRLLLTCPVKWKLFQEVYFLTLLLDRDDFGIEPSDSVGAEPVRKNDEER